MIHEEQNKNNNNDNNERTRMRIGSEKQYVVVKHLLEGLEQSSGEGIDIEDEAKEHHGRTMTTTKTTPTTPTPQQQTRKQEKGRNTKARPTLHFF